MKSLHYLDYDSVEVQNKPDNKKNNVNSEFSDKKKKKSTSK